MASKNIDRLNDQVGKITKAFSGGSSPSTKPKKVTKKWRPIIIAFTVLLALGAMYFFLYMEKESSKFDERRFRVLSRIAENVRNKEKGFDVLLKEIDRECSTKGESKPLETIIKERNLEFVNSGLSITKQPLSEGADYVFPIDGYQVTSGNEVHKIYIKYDLESYLSDAIPKSTFEHFVFLDDDEKRYQTSNSKGNFIRKITFQTLENQLLSYATSSSKADSLLLPRFGLSSGGVRTLEVSGKEYRMYVHVDQKNQTGDEDNEATIRSHATIYCALVAQKEYNQFRRRVNIWLVVFLSILLLLVVISLPLLKNFFINDVERLTSSDAILSGVSIIIGVPLVLLALLSLYAYTDFSWKEQEVKLEKFASTIDSNLHSEVKRIIDDLHDAWQYEQTEPLRIRSDTSNEAKWIFEDTINHPVYHCFSARGINEYYGLKANGEQSFSLTTYRPRNKRLIDLSERDYFKRISGISGKLWRFETKERLDGKVYNKPKKAYSYFMEPVTSWTTGKHEAVVVIKNPFAENETTKYLAISSKLNSIIDPVIPSGYGFALVDSEGNTLFHSIENRIQSENFLEETDGNEYLVAALSGNRDEILEATYWGERIRAHVRPSRNFPFYIITYQKQDHVRVFIAEVVSLGIINIVIGFFLLSIVVYVTYLLDKPGGRKMVAYRAFSFDWLRPRMKRGQHYQLAVMVMLVYAGIYLVLSVYVSGTNFWKGAPNLLIIGLFMPLVGYLTNFWLTKFDERQRFYLEDKRDLTTKYKDLFPTFHLLKNKAEGQVPAPRPEEKDANIDLDNQVFEPFKALEKSVVPKAIFNWFFWVFIGSNVGHYILWTILKGENWQYGGFVFLAVIVLYVAVFFKHGAGTTADKERYAKKDVESNTLRSNAQLLTVHVIAFETFNLIFSSLLDSPWYLWFNVACIVAFRIIWKSYGTKLYAQLAKELEEEKQDKGLENKRDAFAISKRNLMHYSNYLFSWVTTTTALPVFIGFCVIYSVESRIYDRYVQLKAARQYENRALAINQEYSDLPNYFLWHKYRDTHMPDYMETMGFKTDVIKGDQSRKDTVNTRFRGLLYKLRPNYHETIIENKTTIFEYADNNSWRWPDGRLDALYYDLGSPPPFLTQKELDQVKVSTEGKFGVFGMDHSPRSMFFLVLAFGLFFYLFKLIKSVYRNVFGLRCLHYFECARTALDLEEVTAFITEPGTDKTLLIFPAAYYKAKFAKMLNESCTSRHYVIDLEDYIDNSEDLTRVLSLRKVIVLTNHYPYILYDRLEENQELLRKLQALIYECKQLIVSQRLFINNQALAEIQTTNIWLNQELNSSEFVASLAGKQNYFKDNEPELLKRNEVVLRVQQAAYNHYTDIWESLSLSEKYILYDLAEDGIVNTKNVQSMVSLFEKGLIEWSDRLRIMNRSFANYILTAVRKEEGEEIERDRETRGSWAGVRTILYLIIAAALVFIALGEPDFFQDFNTLITVIASIITLFPVIGGLFSTSDNN